MAKLDYSLNRDPMNQMVAYQVKRLSLYQYIYSYSLTSNHMCMGYRLR